MAIFWIRARCVFKANHVWKLNSIFLMVFSYFFNSSSARRTSIFPTNCQRQFVGRLFFWLESAVIRGLVRLGEFDLLVWRKDEICVIYNIYNKEVPVSILL